MTPLDILDEWAKYTNFDPNQTRFNLLSFEYQFHSCSKKLVQFMNYDPSGTLGVIYARTVFQKAMKDARISVADILCEPDCLAEEQRMWNIFNDPDIQTFEDSLLDRIDSIVQQSVEAKMIGQRDREQERNALTSSITAIIEELDKCSVDVFLRGGPIQPINRFSTRIHVFPTLSACLLTLEQSADGIYLCYVDNSGTVDGYFGFYIKSNGTILSISERIDEAYPTEHQFSRNGRWTEAKADALFPYGYIFQFSNYDYKGYASLQQIDETQLDFFKLPAGGYLPLILAMVLLVGKYQGQDFANYPQLYVDSLLTINQKELPEETRALIPVNGSELISANRSFQMTLTLENLMDSSFVKRFSDPKRNHLERGEFPQEENLFVKLYGAGFQLDNDSILKTNKYLALQAADESVTLGPTPEFVGTKERFEVEAYREARIQLADYIRDQMLKAYLDCGGKQGVQDWYNKLLISNREKLFELCVEYNKLQDSSADIPDDSPYSCMSSGINNKGCIPEYRGQTLSQFPFNTPHEFTKYGWTDGKWLCPITGNMATIFFRFTFKSWKQMAMVFGEENLIKPVIGYQEHRIGFGNPLLRATDAVDYIGTVFESNERHQNRRLWTNTDWENFYWDQWLHHDRKDRTGPIPETALPEPSVINFDFAIAFSKRGFARLLKEHEQQKLTEP